jgi:uncharacterized protein DUF2630
MSTQGSDRNVRQHIEDLVKEEHRLREAKAATDADRKRLAAVEVELDQCWDLLRQRRALRESGGDPDRAQARSADVVERYQQ